MGTIVNELKIQEYDSQSVSTVKQNTSASIYSNNGVVNTTAPEEDKKLKRQNELLNLGQDFEPNLSLKQVEKLISDATGIEDIYSVDDKTFELISYRTLPALLEIISNAAKRNNKTLDEIMNNVASNFKASLEDGISLEEATNYISEIGNHNVLEIILHKHPELKKDTNGDGKITLEDIPRDAITDFIKKFIEDGNAFAQNNKGVGFGKSENLFKILLNGLSDEEKQILWDAYKEIATSEEKVQSFAAVINKTENKEKLQAFFKKFDAKTVHALGLDPQDVAKVQHLIYSNVDSEGAKELKELQFKFAEQIHKKVQELKNKDEKEYTDADREALNALQFVKASFAGMTTGYYANKNIEEDEKNELITETLDKSKEYDVYNDVLTNIAELTHDTTGIVNFSEEELKNFNSQMNEFTNGDYNQALETYNASINNNSDVSNGNTETDYGFSTQFQATVNIGELRQSVTEKKEEIERNSDFSAPEFKIETTKKKSSVTTLSEAKELSGSFAKVIADFKNYSDKVIEDAAKTVASFGRASQVYFANLSSNMKFTDAIGNNNNGWTVSQIDKLNLSFTKRAEMTEKAEEREKKSI